MNRLQCCSMQSELLKNMTLIDTPGVLSGEKQKLLRGYDYTAVMEWFAQKVDRILILFDANKLDISDELRGAIKAIKHHDDKIRIVLNKSDSVTSQQLINGMSLSVQHRSGRWHKCPMLLHFRSLAEAGEEGD